MSTAATAAPHRKPGETICIRQVALVALNPHTGQVLALVGGRNTQLAIESRRATPHRLGLQALCLPAAYNTAIEGAILPGQQKRSPHHHVNDEQTTYGAGDQEYTPRNYKDEYHGQVTAIYALAHSLNNATLIGLGSRL